MKKILLLFILILTSFNLSAKKRNLNFKFKELKSSIFTIKNEKGNINIQGWNKDYIFMETTKDIKKLYPKFENIKIKITKGEEIIIQTFIKKFINKSKVDFNIYIPSKISMCNIYSNNGNISISNIKNNIMINSKKCEIKINKIEGITNISNTNGNISALGIKHLKKIITTNGNISAEIINISEEGAKIITTNNNIKLIINSNLSSNLEVRENNKFNKNDYQKEILLASTNKGFVEVVIKD